MPSFNKREFKKKQQQLDYCEAGVEDTLLFLKKNKISSIY